MAAKKSPRRAATKKQAQARTVAAPKARTKSSSTRRDLPRNKATPKQRQEARAKTRKAQQQEGMTDWLGRPTLYHRTIHEEIIARMVGGESLAKITRDEVSPHTGLLMPSAGTVLRWVREHESFRHDYEEAQRWRAECQAEEIVDLCDSTEALEYTDSFGVTRVDPGRVAHQKLRVQTRQWIASRMLPKKYGDRIQHTDPTGQAPARFVFDVTGAVSTDDDEGHPDD